MLGGLVGNTEKLQYLVASEHFHTGKILSSEERHSLSSVQNQTAHNTSAVALVDAERLQAIERSGLLSLGDTSALDQLTSLICQALDVPVAWVSIVTED